MGRRRILIVCHGVLGTGGGSTSACALYRAMLEDGLDARYLTLIEEQDEFYFRYVCGPEFANPDRLPGTSCCVLRGPLDADRPELAAALSAIAPEVVLAVGDQAAILASRHGTGAPVVLYLTGADEIEGRRRLHPGQGLAEAVRGATAGRARTPHPCWPPEAARAAYLIVAPSEAARAVYAADFPAFAGKIHPRAVWPVEWLGRDVARFASSRRPWSERDIDAVLVANRWSRPLKNFRLARRLVARSKARSMVVVGEGQDRRLGASSRRLLPARAEYLGLLGRAKTLVCPSTFEASATPLYEAAAMGCNLVASADCGNVALCHGELVAAPDDAASFAAKLELAVRGPRESRLAELARAESYLDLIETIGVIA